jgi:hypothetical protein
MESDRWGGLVIRELRLVSYAGAKFRPIRVALRTTEHAAGRRLRADPVARNELVTGCTSGRSGCRRKYQITGGLSRSMRNIMRLRSPSWP